MVLNKDKSLTKISEFCSDNIGTTLTIFIKITISVSYKSRISNKDVTRLTSLQDYGVTKQPIIVCLKKSLALDEGKKNGKNQYVIKK